MTREDKESLIRKFSFRLTELTDQQIDDVYAAFEAFAKTEYVQKLEDQITKIQAEITEIQK